MNNYKTKLSALLVALLLGCTSASLKADDSISGSFSLDFNSHFMSYGVNVWGNATDDIGDEFLFQPSFGVEFATSEVSAIYAGVWFDINNLAPDSIGGNFQEIDVWLGYYVSAGDFTFDFTFQHWYYASETEGIFDIAISYDAVDFAPYIKFHNRFEGVGGQETGTIIEIGGTLYSMESDKHSFSIPVGVAFSPSDYHVTGQDGYAYTYISLAYGAPIGGAWDFHSALTYFNTSKSNTGNAETGYLTLNVGVGASF